MADGTTRSADDLTADLARFRDVHHERRVSVNGVSWTYYAGGSGPDVLLFLPGGTGQAEAAFKSITELESHASVLAVTYPEVRRLEELVIGCLAILDAHGVQAANVWGNSFGGMVAQLLIRQAPDRVRALALTNSVAPDPAAAAVERRQRRFLSLLPSPIVRRMIGRGLPTTLVGLDPAQRQFWEGYLRETLLPRGKARLLTIAHLSSEFHSLGWSAPQEAPAWQGRMLLLTPADKSIDPANSERLRELYPSASFSRVPLAGTASSWDLEYARRVSAFFRAG